MQIGDIYYDKQFVKLFRKLPRAIQTKAITTEKQFRANPLHPSLRLHKLKGRLDGFWSISITKQYRIIFEALENGDILFISIGTHAIYES